MAATRKRPTLTARITSLVGLVTVFGTLLAALAIVGQKRAEITTIYRGFFGNFVSDTALSAQAAQQPRPVAAQAAPPTPTADKSPPKQLATKSPPKPAARPGSGRAVPGYGGDIFVRPDYGGGVYTDFSYPLDTRKPEVRSYDFSVSVRRLCESFKSVTSGG